MRGEISFHCVPKAAKPIIKPMQRPTHKELGLDKNGFPPTDETGDVDLNQIEWSLRLTPAERLQRANSFRRFAEACRLDRIRRYGFDPADLSPTE
jgi:hypothetical protein